MDLYVYLYVIIINLIGFIMMGVDKRKAKERKWRVKERTLWLIALIGGALGMTIGMWQFSHKTKHQSFKYGLPILSMIEIIGFGYWIHPML